MTVLCMVLVGAVIVAERCMTARDEWTALKENRP